MGKELVISANRHETKVAVLEDDQLVEIYFQRANEYSLAGSIHKGRVTRVLPGMQSAFVDLGLERDTFLYVSDFFEEHDEYDQLTAVEIRGKQTDERTKATAERPERENAFAGQPGPTPERLAAAQTVAYATAEKAAPTAAPSTPAQGAEKAEEGEGRERRGRRSRRRRGRSRGFPESKYAAGPEQAEGDAETGAEEAAVEEDFLVLPGESLAKYRRAEPQEAKPQEAEPQGSEPQEAGPQEAVEAGETTESAAAAAPESTGEVITEDLEAESVQAAAEEIETSEPVTDRTEEEEEDRLVTEVLNRVEGEAEAAGPSEPEESPSAEAVEATGVVEEKQSRVVELLLATIKPWELLAGKIIGLGAVGLLNLVVLGGIAAIAGISFGLLTLPGAALGMFAMVLVWYLLGFFLFASLYAAIGSTVSRQEELNSVVAPMIFLLLIPFILTVNLLPGDPRNPLATVLSYIPFFSQTVMPARYALGTAELWEVGIAALLALVAIVVVVRLAGRVYRNSVLRTGARVSLREALGRAA